MNTNGFSGAIYRTEYVTICQSMTRVDTPIAGVLFTAFICSANNEKYV